ncbi:MAG: BrnT family toxin [Candidatus Acidiferrales bacterium]
MFADPEALDWEDTRHSEREDRRKRLGRSIGERVPLVVYTSRRLKNDRETVRIVSARQASRKERKAYAGQQD